ncbi:response regulator [uncultured Algibacter sp.]|uniref:response regulator n=1 Tax=uncultured Algibacter sp. TaxID=298659 RepID=UPI002613A419|nr:response regulator [uncultured Algibacter sp.]
MQKQANILIVEDEMLIAYSIQKMVQKHFNVSQVVKNYDQAIQVLENHVIDLALIDITLNNSKSGIDIAQQINKKYNIPFIYLTASTDEATLTKVIQTSPTAYISKPVQETNVITAIKLALVNTTVNNIVLTIGKKEYHINMDQFLFAESEGVYITMHFTKLNSLLLRTTFAKLQTQVPESNFKRINKSEAINPKYITKSDSKMVFLDKKGFKISKKYW